MKAELQSPWRGSTYFSEADSCKRFFGESGCGCLVICFKSSSRFIYLQDFPLLLDGMCGVLIYFIQYLHWSLYAIF